MTASIYQALKDCKNATAAEIREILDIINIDLFDPFWKCPPSADAPEFNENHLPAVISYLIHAYSKDSKMLIFASDSIEEKRRIAEKMDVPLFLQGKVLKLKSETFRKVMLAYLDYQGSRAFKQLQQKKDMYEAASSGNFDTLFEDGKFDTKAMESYMKIIDRLSDEIKTYEEQVKSEFKFVFDNVEDAEQAVKDDKRGTTDTGNIENSKWLDYKPGTENTEEI